MNYHDKYDTKQQAARMNKGACAASVIAEVILWPSQRNMRPRARYSTKEWSNYKRRAPPRPAQNNTNKHTRSTQQSRDDQMTMCS